MRNPPRQPASSEITAPELYARRREFIKTSALFVGTSAALGAGLTSLSSMGSADPPASPPPLPQASPGSAPWRIDRRGQFAATEAQTSYRDITTYNNFYELGFSKSDPANAAFHLKTRPWTLRVTGEVEQERTLDASQSRSHAAHPVRAGLGPRLRPSRRGKASKVPRRAATR